MLRKKIFLLFLLVIPAFTMFANKTAHQIVAEAKRTIKEINITAANGMIQAGNLTILDVREPDEFRAERISGAINIPRGVLEFKVTDVIKNKNQKILVYCLLGGRGVLATQTLNTMGYRNVVNISGGLVAWKASGLKVVR